jgi:hypothetical protein
MNIATHAPSLRTQWMSAIRDDERLTQKQQHVALLLATWMDIDGRCYPSLVTIAEKGRFHKLTVMKTISVLLKMGWLVKLPGGGRGKSNQYQALVNGVSTSPLSPRNGVSAGRNGVSADFLARHERGSVLTPEVIEVSKEESRPATSSPSDDGSSPQEPNPGRSEEEDQVHPSEPTTQQQALDETARFERERKQWARQVAAGEVEPPWAVAATGPANDDDRRE